LTDEDAGQAPQSHSLPSTRTSRVAASTRRLFLPFIQAASCFFEIYNTAREWEEQNKQDAPDPFFQAFSVFHDANWRDLELGDWQALMNSGFFNVFRENLDSTNLELIEPVLRSLHSVLRWIPPGIWQQVSSDEDGALPNRFLADISLSLGPDYTGLSLPFLSCLIELCESSECACYIFTTCRSELDKWLQEACATPWGERRELWSLLAVISAYPFDGFCDWFRPTFSCIVQILSPLFPPNALIPPGLLLTLNHVARVDAESRRMLLMSDVPDYLSKHLLRSPVPQVAHLSILLLHQCLLASPNIQVMFSPNQLFDWLNEKERFAQAAVDIVCILMKHDSSIHWEYLSDHALDCLRRLLAGRDFSTTRLALRLLCTFMQVCDLSQPPPHSFLAFIPPVFSLYVVDPVTPEITAPVQKVSINGEEEEEEEEEEMAPDCGTVEMPVSPDEMRVNGQTLCVSPFGALYFLATWCVESGMPEGQIESIWAPMMSEEEFTDLLQVGKGGLDQDSDPVESSCVNA
jgi:hypothetical protein